MFTEAILDHQESLNAMFKYLIHREDDCPIIMINGKSWIEIQNYAYTLERSSAQEPERLKIEPPMSEEIDERAYIFKRTRQCLDFFKTSQNTRRAAFANQYDLLDNHCISYFHFMMRDGRLDLNVYVRSQNFATNWLWDNYVFEDALTILHGLLTQANIDCTIGCIRVHVASLHILNEQRP